jgi:hypothetical protein
MGNMIDTLEFAEALPNSPFTEKHTRVVSSPISEVWPHCMEVTTQEVRTLTPLFALRGLPAMLRGKRPPSVTGAVPLLKAFEGAGFVTLRCDETPVDGRAVVIFGAAGKFWSVAGNRPLSFTSPQSFLEFNEPGFAKTVARLEAISQPDGTTRIETETLVAGTDRASTAKFAPYWALIRLPSGIIRKSWLAAIGRRCHSERRTQSSLQPSSGQNPREI